MRACFHVATVLLALLGASFVSFPSFPKMFEPVLSVNRALKGERVRPSHFVKI